MKKLVSTELGGHPLTLKDVGFVQDAMYDAIKLQVMSLVGNIPCILWGMNKIYIGAAFGGNSRWDVTEGAYWDGVEILRHSNTSLIYSNTLINPQVYLQVSTNNAVLPAAVYKNGQTKNVYQERYIESTNLVSTTLNLDAQPRMDNLLKSRLGINALTANLATTNQNLTNTNGNVNGLIQDLANTNQNLNDHINVGDHTYQKITNKPFMYGSAYLSDPGAGLGTSYFNSAGYPLINGVAQTNVKVVAQGGSSDMLYEIKLPNNATIGGAYHVYGSIVGVKQGWGAGNYSGYLWNDDNDVGFIIVKKDNNKFHLAVREYSSNIQSLWFEFMIVDLSKI